MSHRGWPQGNESLRRCMTIDPLLADHDNSRFQSVLLAD